MPQRLILATIILIGTGRVTAQTSSDLDLSTRCIGVPPTHATVNSVVKWIENPLDQKLVIAVTNLYANADDYMEIDIGGQREIFYGAGMDEFGNYIPTNYPPVVVNAVLRREYTMSIMCPNSGPDGSPLFKIGDLDPNSFLPVLTNTPTDSVSAYLWTNFTAQGQFALTNDATTWNIQRTNLTLEINRILLGPSIYSSSRFAGVQLLDDTTNLLAQNPTSGQELILLNRLLLRDAYYYSIYLPDGQPDHSGTAKITFSVQPPPELKIKKNQPTPNYTILLNRDSSSGGVLNLENPGTGFASTNYSTIEILKDKFGHFGLGDGCDDATKAPGQGNWLSMGPGCTQDTNRISLEWHVSLGRTFDGLAAGCLAFREPGLTRDSYTPFAIYYNAAYTNLYAEMPLVPYSVVTNSDGSVTTNAFTYTNFYASVTLVTTNIPSLATNSAGAVYTNYDNLLRQVKAYQTFVDILTPDTNQTVLNFYLASQVGTNQDITGLYTNFSGSPFVVWTIKNPSPATANNLLITENRLSGGSTNSLAKTNSAGGVTWTLTQGTGPETRVETRVVSFSGSPPTDRMEVNAIQYANSSTLAYQCKETYHFYPWGPELKETLMPNDPAGLVTTYDYYAGTSESGYGQLKQITYPDGYWEKRVYLVNGVDGHLCWCEAMHPYLVNGEGATSPDSADQDNTSVDEIQPLFYAPAGQREIDTYDQGTLRKGTSAGNQNNQDDSGMQNSWTQIYPNRPGQGWGLDGYLDIQFESDFASEKPPGLTGHPDYIFSSISCQCFCYHHGVFDTSSNEFVLNSTNHLYTWDGLLNRYSDHMETRFDMNVDAVGGSVFVKYNGWGVAYVDGSTFDLYQTIDDYSVYNLSRIPSGGNLLLRRDVSRKHTRIYHGGNLAQTGEYVYTAPEGTGGGGISFNPQFALLYKARYFVDSLGRATNVVRIDGGTSGQTRTIYTADYRGNSGCDGELLLSETDEFGQQTLYSYDSLKRIKTITTKEYGSQPDQTNSYIRDANGQTTQQTTTAGSLALNESWSFDLAGRLTNQVDQSGVAISTSFSANNRVTTRTAPGGITVVQEQSIDRLPLSLQGNGCVSEFYGHDTALASSYLLGALQLQTTHKGQANSPRWRTVGTDVPGNDAWDEWPVGIGTTNAASVARAYVLNRLISGSTNCEGEAMIYFYNDYNDLGRLCFTDTTDGYGDYGPENYAKQTSININGIWYQATTNFVFLADNSNEKTVQSIHLEQLNGFTGSETACTIDYDADNNETTTTTTVDRNNNQITTVTSQPYTSTLSATNVYQNGLPISSSTLSVASPTLYFYDVLGRTNRIQSSLGYSAYISYDPATGWVTSQTDFTGQTTSYQYYNTNEANAGKLKCQTSATGKKTYYAYTTRGELYRTWGDVPYPAEYRYSEYGDLTNLITFRGGANWTSSSWPANPGTGDNTCWVYDEASGALLQKIDAQGQAVTYTYDTTTGRLLTRTWARTFTDASNNIVGVTVTNSYNDFGDLVSQTYNDGTPNVHFNNYNRVGLPREIIDGSGTSELTYDHASRLVTSTCSSGLLNGITVSNHFNPYYGRDAVAVLGLSSSLEDDYVYDNYGRLSSVGSGTCLAAYGYVPNSDLLQSTTCRSNSTTVLTTTRTWDYGMRLRSITNVVGSAPVTVHTYQYDALNRRTQATLEDGSYWSYGYDDRDELTSANRNWSYFATTTPVSGQQFGYAYDNIGNRQTASFGGDQSGTGLWPVNYAVNSLNQYTSIVTPGIKDILGVALATNTVTVNGGVADRHGEYFHRQISVANTNQPVWQNVTNISGSFTNKGGLVFPANSQSLVYDADGNLSFDGVWNYQWDGENRLISMVMTNVAGIANSNRLQLQFAYDFMGRRVQKIVSSWNGSGFTPQSTNRFVYDGWNLLAIINSPSSILQSFMWGQDLSGTMTEAGGIGGLLMATMSGTNCFVGYDGNGNIIVLVNATDKTISTRYEYNPYGELLRATGLLARQNPFRFSTKLWDEESGLVYYGWRYYSPFFGRWISRDPAGDQGGLNFYAFALNAPTYEYDTDGRILLNLSPRNLMYSFFLALKLYEKDPTGLAGWSQMVQKVQATETAVKEASAMRAATMRNGVASGPGGPLLSITAGLALVGLEAAARVMAASGTEALGLSSSGEDSVQSDLRSFYRNSTAGDQQGFADLDAISAALGMTGGAGLNAEVALGVFFVAGDMLADL